MHAKGICKGYISPQHFHCNFDSIGSHHLWIHVQSSLPVDWHGLSKGGLLALIHLLTGT